MKIWRSINHPLKPLLYVEWLLLVLAALYPWITPQNALSIIFKQGGRSISIGIGTSHPLGLLVPIAWIIACIVAWRSPNSNKYLVLFILSTPILLLMTLVIRTLPIAITAIIFGLFFGFFSFLGTQISQQKTALNRWLYIAVEYILIWGIFILTSVLKPKSGIHLESLLILHLVALIRATLMFTGLSRGIAIAAFFVSYHSVSIIIGMVWSDLMQMTNSPSTLYPDDIRHITYGFIFNVTIVFTLITLLIILLVNTLVSERRSREQLDRAHNQLRQYAQRIEDQTLLEERNRIAREIHDSLGHTLTAQSIQLENALLYLNSTNDRTHQFLIQAQTLSKTALQDVRRSVSQIRTNLLTGKSFDSTIADLIQEFQALNACELNYRNTVQTIYIPIEIQTAFYRIIQESLTNIIRHSHAQHVTIEISSQPTFTQLETGTAEIVLQLRITDNGRGFQTHQTSSGFGLQGIRERSAAIGGKLQIQSAPSSGCTIQVEVPIHLWLTPSASSSSMTKP